MMVRGRGDGGVEFVQMQELVEKTKQKAEERVMRVRTKYMKYVGDLKEELSVLKKINHRVNGYNETLKKELVFSKLIIKNPKSMKRATNLMNYKLYNISKTPETTRSFHSTHRRSEDHHSSRKLLSKSPNDSFQFQTKKNEMELRKSFGEKLAQSSFSNSPTFAQSKEISKNHHYSHSKENR